MIPNNPTNLMMCSYQPGVLTSCYSCKPGLLLIEALVDPWDFQIHQSRWVPRGAVGAASATGQQGPALKISFKKGELLDTLERRNDMKWKNRWKKDWRDDNNRITVWGVVLLCIIFSELSYHSVQWGFPQSWMHQSRCFVDGPCVFIFSCLCGCFAGGAVCIVFFQTLTV